MGEVDYPADELDAWLKNDDQQSRPYRVQRLRLLLKEYGDEGDVRLMPGGPVSALAFEEARLAYLHGLYLSCIIVCQTCVEHMLAGLFRMADRDDLDRAPFSKLLQVAKEERFISSDEFDLLDRLRELRNPYVHARGLDAPTNLLRRAMTTDTPFEELIEQDAEYVITTVLRLYRRYPFTLQSKR